MIEFQPVRCECRGLLMEGFGFRGVIRLRCKKCRRRVTLHGDGHEIRITQIGEPPERLAS